MGPPSYMWCVVDRNVVMRRMTVVLSFGISKLGHVWLHWKMWKEGNVRVDLKAGQH
jgi:hypothetical protein